MSGSPPSLFLDHGCMDGDVQSSLTSFALIWPLMPVTRLRFRPVVPLLSRLKQHSIRISLATTKPTSLAATLLVRYDLARFSRSGTDLQQHKPRPDILNACLHKARSGSAVMVGDTVFDGSARNAAIDSIAVCTGAHIKIN